MRVLSEHFNIEDWVDFVRDLVEPERRGRMQQHLDDGCVDCARVVELWQSVLDIARRGRQFEMLDKDIRCARALFAAFPPNVASDVKLRVSHLMPYERTEGVRGPRTSPGRFVLEQDQVLLDLEFKVSSDGVSLMGQILSTSVQQEQYSYRVVKLVGEQGLVAQSTTNEFGEFRLEYRLQHELLLVIELEDKSYLIAPLSYPPT
jgi:hypothetical protein